LTQTADILVNGERLVATTAGALYWPAQDALIVADLHFEKGSSFARRGVLLPPYDSRATLKRLGDLCKQYKPKTIISLGDAFHDADAEARMESEDAAMLEWMIARSRWIWILGNHDPEPPARFRAEVEASLRIGRLNLRHEPAARFEAGEISGHLHPVARVRAESRLIRRRCYATCGDRMIMPAFGAYAGGLNVLDDAIASHFSDFTAWVAGARGVYPFASARLIADPGNRAVGAA
jgi:DNA ligase-associated metallophosphoesterase